MSSPHASRPSQARRGLDRGRHRHLRRVVRRARRGRRVQRRADVRDVAADLHGRVAVHVRVGDRVRGDRGRRPAARAAAGGAQRDLRPQPARRAARRAAAARGRRAPRDRRVDRDGPRAVRAPGEAARVPAHGPRDPAVLEPRHAGRRARGRRDRRPRHARSGRDLPGGVPRAAGPADPQPAGGRRGAARRRDRARAAAGRARRRARDGGRARLPAVPAETRISWWSVLALCACAYALKYAGVLLAARTSPDAPPAVRWSSSSCR